MHILITRPQESATSLANHLNHLGHKVTIDSLIHIIPLASDSLNLPSISSFEAIVTTSQHAIRCLSNLTSQRDYPLWCVGTESAKVARNLGFQIIHTSAGSAENLVAELLKTITPPLDKPILHLSGDVIRMDVVKALQHRGIDARRIVVYKTQEAEALSPETHHALKARALDAVLFYSPRTALIFKNLCQAANLGPYCTSLSAICLSESIKAGIQDLPWKKIRIAKKTTTDDLLMALIMAD